MSKYWGCSKRPKNWKTLLKEDYKENLEESEPFIPERPEKPEKPPIPNRPPVGSPRMPRSQPDSSASHI